MMGQYTSEKVGKTIKDNVILLDTTQELIYPFQSIIFCFLRDRSFNREGKLMKKVHGLCWLNQTNKIWTTNYYQRVGTFRAMRKVL